MGSLTGSRCHFERHSILQPRFVEQYADAGNIGSGITVVHHTEAGAAVRRAVTVLALASVLIVAAAVGVARAAAIKKCPSASSLASAAGTKLKLDHQAKSAGQLVCS